MLHRLRVQGLVAQILPNHIATGKLDSKNRCYSPAFDGTITNHKEIGLGHLLASWLQDYVFTLPS